MAYNILHDNIALQSKGHDFVNSFQEADYAWGVVCDGVSNSQEQAWGAKTAGTIITDFIKNNAENKSQSIDYNAVYRAITDYFNNCASKFSDALTFASKSLYATTVITAIVEREKAVFSYCGNGAILEIRQEWFELPSEIPTPWGITNYLNPHSRLVDGENKLFKVVKATKNTAVCMPDIVSVTREGRLTSYFVICSDGLYSSDEITTGWDEQTNQYYLVENRRLILFLELLRKYHSRSWSDKEYFKEEYNINLKKEALLDDDLSYVLIIPEL